jgi:hypothetical protein
VPERVHLRRPARSPWDALLDRRDDPYTGKTCLQRGHATDVVVVVMGEQDRVHAQALIGQREHRRGIAGVDDHGGAIVVDQRPDVVIRKCGQGSQSHRIGPCPRCRAPVKRARPRGSTVNRRALRVLERQLLLPQLSVLPTQPWLWIAPSAAWLEDAQLGGRGLRLYRQGRAMPAIPAARCRCRWPTRASMRSCCSMSPRAMPTGCSTSASVLMPGGHLWLSSLNPFSPYRTHWRQHGLVVRTPQRIRLLLGRHGLECDDMRYLGPLWRGAGSRRPGVGRRCARPACSMLKNARWPCPGRNRCRCVGTAPLLPDLELY